MSLPTVTSHTQMRSEEACPKRFFHKYVTGLNKVKKNVAMEVGIVCGEIIEKGLLDPLESPDEEADRAEVQVTKAWMARMTETSLIDYGADDTTVKICTEPTCLEAHKKARAIPDTIAGVGELFSFLTGMDLPEKVPGPDGKLVKAKRSDYDALVELAHEGVYGFKAEKCPSCESQATAPLPWLRARLKSVRVVRAFFLSPERKRISGCTTHQPKIYISSKEWDGRRVVCYPDLPCLVDGELALVDIKCVGKPYDPGLEHIDTQLTGQALAAISGLPSLGNYKIPVKVGFAQITTGENPTVELRMSYRDEKQLQEEAARVSFHVARVKAFSRVGIWPMYANNGNCGFCDYVLACRIETGETSLQDEAGRYYSIKKREDR